MIRISVNTDLRELESRVVTATERAQYLFDEQVLKDSNYYIPMDTQALERSGITNSKLGDGLLIWNTPYARKQYYGIDHNFSKDKNPNARALWFEYAKSIHLNSWKRILSGLIEDNL